MNKLPFAAILLSGCFHVALEPPPRSNYDQRVAAYQRLRPTAIVYDVSLSASRYGATISTSTSMMLVDGTTVDHADDLLPVLDPATPAAKHAQRSAVARTRKIWSALGGFALMVVGGSYILGHISIEHPLDATDYAALTAVGVGSVVGALGPLYFAQVERNERRGAFALYDTSLRESLQICVDRMWLVDCAQLRSGPAASR